MSTVIVAASLSGSLVDAIGEAGLPSPTSVTQRGGIGPVTITWTPDLDATQQATVDRLLKLAVGATLLSDADRMALEPRMVELRTFRQQSQAEFMAKTANQRDRELFDATNDLIAIVLRLLRD